MVLNFFMMKFLRALMFSKLGLGVMVGASCTSAVTSSRVIVLSIVAGKNLADGDFYVFFSLVGR